MSKQSCNMANKITCNVISFSCGHSIKSVKGFMDQLPVSQIFREHLCGFIVFIYIQHEGLDSDIDMEH